MPFLLLFHSDLVVPDALDRLLQIINLLILHGVVAVLLVQLGDQLPQLELLALHKDVVALEVFVFLFGEHNVELVVELRDLVIDQLLAFPDHLVPHLSLRSSPGSGAR